MKLYAKWQKIFHINFKLISYAAPQELWPQSQTLPNIPLADSSFSHQEYNLYDIPISGGYCKVILPAQKIYIYILKKKQKGPKFINFCYRKMTNEILEEPLNKIGKDLTEHF